MESSETSDEVQWYGASVMTPLDLCALQVPQCLEVANHAYMQGAKTTNLSLTASENAAAHSASLLSYPMIFHVVPFASKCFQDTRHEVLRVQIFRIRAVLTSALQIVGSVGTSEPGERTCGRREAF